VISVSDGFIRFLCSCGRRLKVPAQAPPNVGRCPDCGRVVPVPLGKDDNLHPTHTKTDAGTRTQELDAFDLSELKKWSAKYFANCVESQDYLQQTRPAASDPVVSEPDHGLFREEFPGSSFVKFEAGLRMCPNCQKPLHLGADNCRGCGIVFPRR